MNIHWVDLPSDRTIECSRILHAPIELVYKAWSEPAHLKNWWGPSGFTNTFHEFDFRVGGKWKFIMHGPDRGNYVNECEFLIIEKNSVIAWKRISKPLFNILARFESMDEASTRNTFNMIFSSAAECAKLRPYVIDKNEENFDRLEKELLAMSL